MTSIPSAGDAAAWAARFLKYQALEVAAQRRRDIPAANRHVEKVTEALAALAAAGIAGRSTLEKFLQDPDPSIRGRSASEVIAWDPDRAIPVLARLLYEPLDPESASSEAVLVRLEARSALLRYFGRDIFDPTELPDCLAAMGIDLPEDTVRRLRRTDRQ